MHAPSFLHLCNIRYCHTNLLMPTIYTVYCKITEVCVGDQQVISSVMSCYIYTSELALRPVVDEWCVEDDLETGDNN